MASQVWTLVAGVVVAAGGVMGYAKARSVPSLVAGVAFGSLYGLSTLYMEPYQTAGNAAAVLVSLLLTFAMGRRYLASGKPMPGAVAAVGAITGLLNAYTLYNKL